MAEFPFPLPAGTVIAGVEAGIKEQQWAQMAPLLGADVAWHLYSGVFATAVPGASQTRIAPFLMQAAGFSVKTQTAATVPHRPQATGSRYDYVFLRLDWTPDVTQGGGKAQLVVIEGGTSSVLPTARETTAGTKFDVPVAQTLVTPQGVQVTSLHVSATKVLHVESLLAIPAPRMGQVAYVGKAGDRYRFDGSTWRNDAPATKVLTDPSIEAYSAAVTAADPKRNRLLAQIAIPDPGYPYAVMVSGQFELASKYRVVVGQQYASTASMAGALPLRPQYFISPSAAVTQTLTTQTIPARTGPTVINALIQIDDRDYVKGASYITTPYNGFYQAVVLPR